MENIGMNAQPSGLAQLIEQQKLGTHLQKGGLEKASVASAERFEPPADLAKITGKGNEVDIEA